MLLIHFHYLPLYGTALMLKCPIQQAVCHTSEYCVLPSLCRNVTSHSTSRSPTDSLFAHQYHHEICLGI